MTTTYMLELTEGELLTLWALLTMRALKTGRDDEEIGILEKVNRLMEGK